jgi:hypothetical protein
MCSNAIEGDVVKLHASAEKLGRLEQLDKPAGAAAKAVGQVVGQGFVKDLLSGSQLGHPLHPLLTDVPIGALSSATVLDLVGGHRAEHAADVLVALGLLSALPTVAAGLPTGLTATGPISASVPSTRSPTWSVLGCSAGRCAHGAAATAAPARPSAWLA